MRPERYLLVCLMSFVLVSVSFAAEYVVYVKVIEKAQGSFVEVSNKVESALKNAGWEVLAAYNTGIYEDETVTHVTVLNTASLNRTIIHEAKLDDLSRFTINSIVDTISKHVPGTIAKKQIGEIRIQGKVGGIGGDFLDKAEEVYAA